MYSVKAKCLCKHNRRGTKLSTVTAEPLGFVVNSFWD